jgi:PadR family transcriptional regulator, regulatory protein PadR
MTMQPDLFRATLEAILLEVIEGGATYGYEIARAIQQRSEGQLLAGEGTLYPALHRLEKRKLLKSTWSVSPEGRRRKHYHLTPAGQKRRAAAHSEWASFAQAIDRLLKPGPSGTQCSGQASYA